MQGFSYYIQTFGCQMNEQDSLRMATGLEQIGGLETSAPEEADVLVVNTCSIRHKAEQKAGSLLGRFRRLKERKPEMVLVAAGCVSQRMGERLRERLPHLDIILGPHHVSELASLVESYRENRERILAVSQREGTWDDLECPGISAPGSVKAFMTIMEGCNNFCSFCLVPFVRGRERSRPLSSLLSEATRLATEKGIPEITLLGQNVNAYVAPDRQGVRFPELLRELGSVSGLRRLRFTTSHPKDLSQDLVACFGEIEVLCEHVHAPLQSGSDRVLGAMNRGYSAEVYLDKIAALRERVPWLAVSSDMIVGFPGEEEEDFERTLEMVRRVRFDSIYAFRFSSRPGTRAAGMEDSVAAGEKARRLSRLQELQNEIGLDRNRELEGATVEVLVEGKSRKGGPWMGRTRTNKVVNFSGPGARIGEMTMVSIRKGLPHSLLGEEPPGTECRC